MLIKLKNKCLFLSLFPKNKERDSMLNKGDFIKLEYTGYDDKGNVFDSTNGEIAKKLHNKEGTLLIVFGYDRLVVGLEEALANMKKGESKEVQLTPDKAFGARSKEMIRVLSENELLKNEIRPQVGLTLQLDTDQGPLFGTVKAISSGRVTIDFNHPLASKNLKYSVKLVDMVTDTEAKVSSLLEDMQLKGKSKLVDGKLELELIKSDDKDYENKKQYLSQLIKLIIPEIKEVEIKEVNL